MISYKGVIAYVRVFNGSITRENQLLMMSTKIKTSPVEIGYFAPDLKPIQTLKAGDVGYIATGLKTVSECRVGDTVTNALGGAAQPLPGYRQAKPMVFAGIYPTDG
jgi:GTP-binding protein LepA